MTKPARDRIWFSEEDTDFGDLSGRTPPKKLMFTLTGKCNLRCAHCARGIFDIPAHETPDSLVEHVIERVLPHLRAVRLGGTDLGEQLISRHFDRFLKAVESRSEIELEIVSNLSVLRDSQAELIARACREFAVSLEGTDEFFESTRGFSWSRFLDNLRRLHQARICQPGSRLRIFALVTCYYDNLDQLERLLDLRAEGIDLFRFRYFRPNESSQEAQALEHHRAAANETFQALRAVAAERGILVDTPPPFEIRSLVGIASHRRAGSLSQTADPGVVAGPAPRWICHFPFEMASVFSDGKVSPCCEDIEMGRLDDRRPDLDAIFRSASWVELRRQVAAGEYAGKCITCEFRRSRDGATSIRAGN